MSLDKTRARYEALARRLRPTSVTVSDEDFFVQARPFSRAEVREAWTALLESERFAANGSLVSLYVHSMLCATKCTYCQCESRPIAAAEERSALLEAIVAEADSLADVFRSVVFKDAYFGGGTPSLFTAAQLDRLLEAVLGRFQVSPDAERSIELNPASTTRDKLRVIRAHGLNRVSYGVQTLTSEVLEAHNRGYQRSQKVSGAVAGALDAGFAIVNVDLLFLPGETLEGWRASVEQILAATPTTVHFYRLQETPRLRMKGFSLERHERSLPEAYDIFQTLCREAGYACKDRYRPIQMAYVAERRDADVQHPTYRQNPREGASLLGLGPGARSICRNHVRYENRAGPAGGAGFRPRYFGAPRSWDDEARAYLITSLAHAPALDRERFAARLGVDPVQRYPEEFQLLYGFGYAEEDRDLVRWTTTNPTELWAAALVLVGRERMQALRAELAERDPGGRDPAALPTWLELGPVGKTGWMVTGQDKAFPDSTRLEGPNGELVLFTLRPQRRGDDERFCRDGWVFSYRETPAPPGAARALLSLYRRAIASAEPE